MSAAIRAARPVRVGTLTSALAVRPAIPPRTQEVQRCHAQLLRPATHPAKPAMGEMELTSAPHVLIPPKGFKPLQGLVQGPVSLIVGSKNTKGPHTARPVIVPVMDAWEQAI